MKIIHNITVMGRKTYFSFTNQLKGKINYVLTKTPEIYKQLENDKLFFVTENELFDLTKKHPNKIVYIIGGEEIFKKYIPLCDKVWVTQLKEDYKCDTFLNYDYPSNLKTYYDNKDYTIYLYNKIL